MAAQPRVSQQSLEMVAGATSEVLRVNVRTARPRKNPVLRLPGHRASVTVPSRTGRPSLAFIWSAENRLYGLPASQHFRVASRQLHRVSAEIGEHHRTRERRDGAETRSFDPTNCGGPYGLVTGLPRGSELLCPSVHLVSFCGSAKLLQGVCVLLQNED